MNAAAAIAQSDFFARVNEDASAEGRGRCFLFANVRRMTGLPALVAYYSGQSALGMESLSDSEVVANTLLALKSIFGNETVPDPVSHHVTRWNSDPHARGMYSYILPGGDPSAHDVLAAQAKTGDLRYYCLSISLSLSFYLCLFLSLSPSLCSPSHVCPQLTLQSRGDQSRLLIAGEHCNRLNPGCAGGSYVSGVRAAGALIALHDD